MFVFILRFSMPKIYSQSLEKEKANKSIIKIVRYLKMEKKVLNGLFLLAQFDTNLNHQSSSYLRTYQFLPQSKSEKTIKIMFLIVAYFQLRFRTPDEPKEQESKQRNRWDGHRHSTLLLLCHTLL